MENKKSKTQKKENLAMKENSKLAGASISSRGRAFEGIVVKKFLTRIVVEFDRIVYVPKYERFYKKTDVA